LEVSLTLSLQNKQTISTMRNFLTAQAQTDPWCPSKFS